MQVERFTLPCSQPAVDDLRARLRATRWPAELSGSPWAHGFDRKTLIELCSWWRDEFDWKAQIDRLSALDHFLFTSGAHRIHFVYERGRGPNPLPLILTHGWPGSFVEMINLIPMLTDPASHGGAAEDSFDVVVPSLPGYGFSGPPAEGTSVFRVAELWVELMQALGYERFAAQGGDIGAGVTTALGLRHPERAIGVHLNFIPGSYHPSLRGAPPLSNAERHFIAEVHGWRDENGAYSHLQSTRPQTAGYALNDSPAGLAAWILEKFREWSDCDGDLLRCFDRNELFTNVTLYWMTQTIHSSFRMYYEGRKAPMQLRKGERVSVPCAVAHFPKEILFPPRAWVERGYNIRCWTEMPRGGHFAALEQPELLAEDIRSFFRDLRG
jgi:pimeloyl-ACP methyl ester carboxylesterase